MYNYVKDLLETIKKYPNGHIYYSDNGVWSYYKDKKAFDKACKEDDQDALNDLEVFTSDNTFDGYMPLLEQALCKMVGITIETV